MGARVYACLSACLCTSNFACVPKCVYLWPRPPLPFYSFRFPRPFFAFDRVTLPDRISRWSGLEREGQLGAWLKSGEPSNAVQGLRGVAILEIRRCSLTSGEKTF